MAATNMNPFFIVLLLKKEDGLVFTSYRFPQSVNILPVFLAIIAKLL